MLRTEHGVKRKDKGGTVPPKSMTTVSHKGTMSTAETTSARVCSTVAPAAATSSVFEHDLPGSFIMGRQSPELTPLPDSDSYTPAKPDGKRLKGDLMLTQLQSNVARLINERADSLESMVNHNTISIDALKKISWLCIYGRWNTESRSESGELYMRK